ncbi:MAG: acetyl-CoA hydrolase/transferase family protein [Desulfobulbus sp.]
MPKELSIFSEIAARLGPSPTVVVHSAFAEPQTLLRQLAEAALLLHGARLFCLMPMVSPPYIQAEAVAHFKVITFMPGTGLRRAVNSGLAQVERCSFSAIPQFFAPTNIKVHLLLLQVSPPDASGHVSLGITVDYMRAVLAQKPLVVAQVNARMPCTCGDTLLPLTALDYVLHHEEDLVRTGTPIGADAVDQAIAEHVAGLVEPGDVLQVGIGTLPDLVLGRLDHLRNLGGHTGILSAGWQRLIENGVVNNSTKKEFCGTTITTMAGGDASLYRFLHRNPLVEFHPCSLTHSQKTLAAIDRLCAVNSVLQMDLAANCNAESVAGRIIAAPGGLPDFARAASQLTRGKSIVALRSSFVARQTGKRVSNIVADFYDKAPVSLSGKYVDFAVTEYGVAALEGLSASQRAKALIALAHPEHQQQLHQQLRRKTL